MAIWWLLLVADFRWFSGGLWWQTGGEQVEARPGGAAHGGGGLLRHLKTHPDIIACVVYRTLELFGKYL